MGLFTFAEKSDKPKFKKTKEEGCVISATMEIPGPLIDNERHNVLLRLQEQAKIPGFRPGKAPISLVESHYHEAVRERVLNRVAEKFVPELLKEFNLNPVAASVIKNIEWNKSLKLELQIEVAPKVDPKDYERISLSHKKYPVTEELLAAEIEKLRDANSCLEKAEEDSVGNNHYAVISYAAFREGKLLPKLKHDSELIDLSSDQLIEGLAPGLLGMKRGESKDISVKFQGKETVLKTTLIEIKKKTLPSLDAEFAKDMGVESLDELKNNVRQAIQKESSQREDDEIHREIDRALLKANSVPLPPSLVDHETDRFIERVARQNRHAISEPDVAKLKKEIRPQVEDNLRLSYIFSAIADKEKIEMTDEDYNKELEEAVVSLRSEAEKEDQRKFFEQNKSGVARLIRERKARIFVREKAAIKGEA
jgi:trigger factor